MTERDYPEIVVTGIGLLTPAGRGVDASWKGILAGTPAAAPDPMLQEADISVTISCRVPDFDPAEVGPKASRRLDHFVQLAVLASREAVEAADLPLPEDDEEPDEFADRLAVIFGCAVGGMETWEEQHETFLERGRVSPLFIPKMLSNMAAGQVAIELGARGPNMTINTACAASASAIHVARDMLRSGTADAVLAGGVEAGVTPLATAAFARMGALSTRNDETASRPFDTDRDGFVMGEGSGVLVLERAEDARARGATPLAVLAGAGASADAHHQTAPPEEGGGAILAMQRALADAGLEPGDIDHINAHGTSTPLNDVSESRAIRSVFGSAADGVAVSSTKGVTGHTLGAAGGVEAAFSVLALRDGVIPPTANVEKIDDEIQLDVVHGEARGDELGAAMSNSFGFGGQNSALIFRTV
ncbi:MAG TPA: beta-ketoacyl-ACP synthase II [Nitriliruptorales bacterium]|nr:beta-ketoacyl-ACP synthase II [Nitriliruptorales bacterium]